jgi:hypothetical protein
VTKGVVYKNNGTTWTKCTVKDTGNGTSTTWDDGKIQHWYAGGNKWEDNYPMEQLYEQYFNVTWTHGYKWGTGQILDEATWGNHPRCGDATADFCGMWGFDNTALKNFVTSTGKIQKLQIEVMFDDPTHASNPYVYFGAHTYAQSTAPTSFSQSKVNTTSTNIVYHTFVQTGADFSTWITLPITAYLSGTMGGVYVHASATAGNSARFAGKTTSNGLNAYTSRLYVQVLK